MRKHARGQQPAVEDSTATEHEDEFPTGGDVESAALISGEEQAQALNLAL